MVVIHLYRCPGITVESAVCIKKYIHSEGEQTPDVTIVFALHSAIT